MKHNYVKVIACLLLSSSGCSLSFAQSGPLEFLQCSSEPISLCVQDEGVRLPPNNQIFLGEGHAEATSCSVHFTQKTRVHSSCSGTLQYEVQMFLYDTSAAYILKPFTNITTDSTGEAELIFNSEESPEEEIWLNGIPYTTGCHPYHRIKWIVRDSCGHETVCEQRTNIYDCNAPAISIASHLFLYYFSNSAYIQVYGEDFISAEDDCTLWEDFLVSFDSLTHQPFKEFYFCDVPGFEFELAYNLWIADHGIDSNCDGTIAWNERNVEKRKVIIIFIDNTLTIDCFTGFLIEGEVRTENGEGIKDVAIELSSTGQQYPTYVTEADGKYFFQLDSLIDEVTISPSKNDFHKNGVSTLDLVKLQKHLLGIDTFDNPYHLIAADANNSQNVSAIDLIEIRKIILGIYSEFPSNKSWRFVRANYFFPDSLNPWPTGDRETITITDTSDIDPGDLDFIGIKIGDVNNTAIPNFTQLLPRQPLKPCVLITGEQRFKAGELINVPVFLSKDQQLTGFQFTISTLGLEYLDLIPGAIDLTEDDYAVLGDHLTMSWFDESMVNISSGEALFTLKLSATAPGYLSQMFNLNSEITSAEIYLEDESTFLPVLYFDQPITQKEWITVYPNPWKQTTSIYFNLHHEGRANIILTDINGQEVFKYENLFPAGTNRFDLISNDFNARGLLFCQIQTNTQSATTRMLVID